MTLRRWVQSVLMVLFILVLLLLSIISVCLVGFHFGTVWCVLWGLTVTSVWGGTAVWAM